MLAVSPRWLLHLLPWVNVQGGIYQVNRRRIVLTQGARIVAGLEGDRAQIDPQALRSVPLLRNATDPLLDATAGLLFDERHNSNEVLYSEGDASTKLYIIIKGKVEITTTDAHGEKLRLAIYGDGDYFGETALVDDRRHTTTARTLTPTVFVTLERDRFTGVLDGSPALRTSFDELVAQHEASGAKHNEYGEAAIDITTYREGEPALPRTFVDYDDTPRQHHLSVMQTVIRLHTRVTDLYNDVYDQLREQLRLTFEGMKEREESEIVNDPEFGLLHTAPPSMRIQTRSGPPTPDDLDDLLAHVWKEPGVLPRSSARHCRLRPRGHAPRRAAADDAALRLAVPHLARRATRAVRQAAGEPHGQRPLGGADEHPADARGRAETGRRRPPSDRHRRRAAPRPLGPLHGHRRVLDGVLPGDALLFRRRADRGRARRARERRGRELP